MRTINLNSHLTISGYTITGEYDIIGTFFHKETNEYMYVLQDTKDLSIYVITN
jgi:hypothetical protein